MRVLIPEHIAAEREKGRNGGELTAASLFVDVGGFTTMTATLMQHGKRGAEELSRIINAVFDPLSRAVYNAGGIITTFAGDAFTAIFPERGPEAALRAAGGIRRSVDREHLQRTPFGEFAVEARIGISYGRAQWGVIEAQNSAIYWVGGDAINGAAHAEHRADAGGIAMDEAARASLKLDVPLSPSSVRTESRELKGFSRPVPVYRVAAGGGGYGEAHARNRQDRADQRAGDPPTGRTADSGGDDHPAAAGHNAGAAEPTDDAQTAPHESDTSPLYGREESAAQLNEWIDELRHADQGSLMRITGEAGIGKSQLVRYALSLRR